MQILMLRLKTASFAKCITHLNDEHIDTAENIDIKMPMYNLIEYSDNSLDISGSLWQSKRYELPITNDGNPNNLTSDKSISSKYKLRILGKPAAAGNNGVLKGAKITVPRRYLSNFWRSLEMPFINCKIHLELSWIKNCVTSSIAEDTVFKITGTKIYIPIVTLEKM